MEREERLGCEAGDGAVGGDDGAYDPDDARHDDGDNGDDLPLLKGIFLAKICLQEVFFSLSDFRFRGDEKIMQKSSKSF